MWLLLLPEILSRSSYLHTTVCWCVGLLMYLYVGMFQCGVGFHVPNHAQHVIDQHVNEVSNHAQHVNVNDQHVNHVSNHAQHPALHTHQCHRNSVLN